MVPWHLGYEAWTVAHFSLCVSVRSQVHGVVSTAVDDLVLRWK